MAADFRQAVQAAADRPDVLDAVARIHADLQHEIDRRRPVCQASGRCCRFEQFGHRLYVTTIQLAAFVHDSRRLNPSPPLPKAIQPADMPACPFQIGKLCGVHAIRPFGCRVFFCDPAATDWQQEQYQRFHARLKSLHDQLGVPYYYLEWRAALASSLELLPPLG